MSSASSVNSIPRHSTTIRRWQGSSTCTSTECSRPPGTAAEDFMRRLFSALVLLATSPALVAAQAQAAPAGPLSLLQAIALGRKQAVDATIARLNARAADARSAQRRADLLPNISGSAGVSRQTVNLDEFGIPSASGVTDPFTSWR